MLSDSVCHIWLRLPTIQKLFYANCIHTTYTAHGIYQITEKIMDIFHKINDLINGKKNISESF